MDKAYPFAIQNLMRIEISKMMALHDTLVDDSENWTTSTNLVLFFLLVCFTFVFDQNLAEHLHCDKGLSHCHHTLCALPCGVGVLCNKENATNQTVCNTSTDSLTLCMHCQNEFQDDTLLP